ncbi:hypothetical protein JAAARDRAFT_47987 [Jaapia argillacea MUCL 33604]|uniref:Uncharacterized protein n=1 Tax=Jaapia argillacea MUCL 33604 TaxID=933084 RepID=A0A067Q1Z9_9AGAM|nr:hypothetical protein JAAARDRAFT_47987 [Jaapia argillacea MUCL 33604]
MVNAGQLGWGLGIGLAFNTLLLWTSVTQAFSVSFSPPSECDVFNVSWWGGEPPFHLYLTPVYGTPRNITIPSSDYVNGTGQYSMILPFPQHQQFILSMFDATGVPSGGTSDLLTVGENVGHQECNTTDPGVDFYYQLNSPLEQCETYTFSAYTNAIQPVTILGIIPARDPVALFPPIGPTSYNWTANLTAGSSVVFVMFDFQGRQGGASNITTVGYSGNYSCLHDSSTSTSSMAPPPTQTSNTNPTTGTTYYLSPGNIAGIVIGVAFGVAVFALMIWYCMKRRKEDKEVEREPPNSGTKPFRDSLDLAQEQPAESSLGLMTPGEYTPTPFMLQTPPTPENHNAGLISVARRSHVHSAYTGSFYDDDGTTANNLSPGFSLLSPPYTPTTLNFRPRKTSEQLSSSSSPTQTPHTRANSLSASTRVLVHRDAEDEFLPEVPPLVELPPEYNERRRPATTLTVQNRSDEGGEGSEHGEEGEHEHEGTQEGTRSSETGHGEKRRMS